MFKSFIPYGKHEITRSDISSVTKVLRSQNLTQGSIVPDFEKRLSLKVFQNM